MDEKLIARFWAKVDRDGPIIRADLGPCWIWFGSRGGAGHGFMQITSRPARRNIQASHVSLSLAGVCVPEGMHACHRCDNPPCVNPDHLFVGTRSDNMSDASKKGRMGKLAPRTVLEIRAVLAEGLSTQEAASRYGVSIGAIHHLGRGYSWQVLPVSAEEKQRYLLASKRSMVAKISGESSPHAKLTEAEVRGMRIRRASGEKLGALAKEFRVSTSLVSAICLRLSWKHVA